MSRVRRTRERSWQPGLPSRKIQFRYDRINRVTEIADARQGITRFGYDPTGNQLLSTRSGLLGTLTAITDSVGRTIQFSYLNGRITDLLDPLGRHVTYAYDNQGRLATVTDPEGGVTRYTYDIQGRVLTLTDARNITFLTNEYDSAGRVSKQTQADSGTWLFAYTTSSGIITQTTVTDPNGKQQTMRFNGRGYGLESTDGQGQMTQSRRDQATNQVMSTTDSLGRTTTFEYEAMGTSPRLSIPRCTRPASRTRRRSIGSRKSLTR